LRDIVQQLKYTIHVAQDVYMWLELTVGWAMGEEEPFYLACLYIERQKGRQTG